MLSNHLLHLILRYRFQFSGCQRFGMLFKLLPKLNYPLHKQLWTVLVSSFKMLIWQYAMMKEVLNPLTPYRVTFSVQHQISLKSDDFFCLRKPEFTDFLHFHNKSILNSSYYFMLVFPCMWNIFDIYLIFMLYSKCSRRCKIWTTQVCFEWANQFDPRNLKTENRLCVHGLNVNHVNYLP